MIHDFPTLGIRFNIDKAGGGYYGLTCWRTFWETVEPSIITNSWLYEGDSSATLRGAERTFLIAVQSSDSTKLNRAQQVLSANPAFLKIAASPPFASDNAVVGEPLVQAGSIDSAGNLVGEAHASGAALGEVQRARIQAQMKADDSPVPARASPASARTAILPDVTSIRQLGKVLEERCSPRNLYEHADIWITPEELCDVVERYAEQLVVQWYEYGQNTLAIDLFWREPRESSRLQFRSFQLAPTPAEALRRLRQGWEISYKEGGPICEYIDLFPKLAGLDGRYQRNFQGMINGGLDKDYDRYPAVPAQELWPRLFRQIKQFSEKAP